MPPSEIQPDGSQAGGSATDTQSTPTSAASTEPLPATIPVAYSRFAVPLAITVFILPAMVLLLADNLARGHFSSGKSVASFAVMTAISLLIAARERARLQSSAGASPEIRTNIRKIGKIALVSTLLLTALTFLVGYQEGKSGSETKAFVSHLRERRELGIRISAIRQRANPGIPGQIRMYEAISAEVNELDALLRQLRTEFALYQTKYQVKDEEKISIVQSFDTDAAWVAIVKKEIAVAKQLDAMDESARSERWNSEMIPLLIQEQLAAGAK